uniref:Uncharacterized protein n=1 Tax=Trichuris muris TaxID=70415 RepID=A0A5S6Q118_TRIMR
MNHQLLAEELEEEAAVVSACLTEHQIYDSALLATGAIVEATKAVVGGKCVGSIALVGLPGHNAMTKQVVKIIHLTALVLRRRIGTCTTCRLRIFLDCRMKSHQRRVPNSSRCEILERCMRCFCTPLDKW